MQKLDDPYKSYLELRKAYNLLTHEINKHAFLDFIPKLQEIIPNLYSQYERDLVEDLIDDIEIRIENLDKPKLKKIIEPSEDTTEDEFELPLFGSEIIYAIEPSSVVEILVTNKTSCLMRELEIEAIRYALAFTEGNRTQAAKILGISIRTLRNKINELINTGRIKPYDLSRVC